MCKKALYMYICMTIAVFAWAITMYIVGVVFLKS